MIPGKTKLEGALQSSALRLSPETSGGFTAELLFKFASNQVLSLCRAGPVISTARLEWYEFCLNVQDELHKPHSRTVKHANPPSKKPDRLLNVLLVCMNPCFLLSILSRYACMNKVLALGADLILLHIHLCAEKNTKCNPQERKLISICFGLFNLKVKTKTAQLRCVCSQSRKRRRGFSLKCSNSSGASSLDLLLFWDANALASTANRAIVCSVLSGCTGLHFKRPTSAGEREGESLGQERAAISACSSTSAAGSPSTQTADCWMYMCAGESALAALRDAKYHRYPEVTLMFLLSSFIVTSSVPPSNSCR